METLQFKTNINCGGCVAKVTPSLNEAAGEGNWKVDTQNPKKILSVTSDKLDDADIIKAVQKAGFKAEELV